MLLSQKHYESNILTTEGLLDSSLHGSAAKNRAIGSHTGGKVALSLKERQLQQRRNMFTQSHIESLLKKNYDDQKQKIKLHVASHGNQI